MDIEEAVSILRKSADHQVIERLPILAEYNPTDDQAKKLAIYLDCETTGFSSETDKIIELAMILFEYGSDGRIYRIVDVIDQYQDPGFPIPGEITRITGITDDMVRGQSIDTNQVAAMLDQAVLIIAHNAQFDRPFSEKLLSKFEDKCWACSMKDIPWAEEEIESAKLEYLAYKFGVFYEGHRADIDCYAGIYVLNQTLPKSGRSALKVLLENAARPRFEIRAVGSPFDTKDALKARGYRWLDIAGGQKCWVKTVTDDSLPEEEGFLAAEVYGNSKPRQVVKKVTPYIRFSSREPVDE